VNLQDLQDSQDGCREKTRASKSTVQPLAYSAEDAAAAHGMSRSQWWKLHSCQLIPAPVRIGLRKRLWIIEELKAWHSAGCPNREIWEQMKKNGACNYGK
jgi:predicted DNA-binding transcriptional regulator AlpA